MLPSDAFEAYFRRLTATSALKRDSGSTRYF
jgi:hypothetical protein